MDIDAAAAHIPRLRRYARALVGDAARADDLVQDTLERACRKWALWRPPAAPADQVQAALRGWLLTLMHNLFANQWREAARERTIDWDEAPEPGHDPTPALGLRLDLERALAMLAPQAREVLLLAEFSGLAGAEIAKVLGVPAGTVASRKHHAMQRLKALLGETDHA